MRKPKNKLSKMSIVTYTIGAVFVIYVGLIFAPYLHGTIFDMAKGIVMMQKSEYFHIKLQPNTYKVIGIFLVAYVLAIAMYLTNSKNYRRGEEHGSAKWGDVHRICRKYSLKEKKRKDIEEECMR